MTETAAERNKADKTMQAMNERFSNCPVRESQYEIDGVKVIVVAHFTGKKDLNEVLYNNAVDRAMSEMLAPEIQSRKF